MESANKKSDMLETLLSENQYEKVSECLSSLADKLQVAAIFLVNSAGNILAKRIKSDFKVETTLLSTLTASCYTAAKEMARLIGETSNFKMVLHEGGNYNVFVSSLNNNYFLIVVFQSDVAIGMVRLFTKKTTGLLLPILSSDEINKKIQLNNVIDHNFETLLGEELDRTLNGR